MINGVVTSAIEAVVVMTVTGPQGQTQTMQCIIDTGFSGHLTLPMDTIHHLSLPWASTEMGSLADGSLRRVDVYRAVVQWNDKPRLIEIEASECLPLLGMSLLKGFDLFMSVRDGGLVRIQEPNAEVESS